MSCACSNTEIMSAKALELSLLTGRKMVARGPKEKPVTEVAIMSQIEILTHPFTNPYQREDDDAEHHDWQHNHLLLMTPTVAT